MNRLTRNVLTETSPMYELGEWADNEEALDKLDQLEDIEEKHNISSLDDLDKKLTILKIIKKHKLLNYVLKNEKCANMYHLSKEECDLLREIEK